MEYGKNQLPIEKMLLTEDYISQYIEQIGGLLITRRLINKKGYKGYDMKNPIACINGYKITIDDFFNNCLPKFKEKVVLVIIEFDKPKFNISHVDNNKIKHILTWNKPFQHPKISALPIGLNFDRQQNTIRKWLDKGGKCTGEKLLALTHFANTHTLRGKITEYAKKKWNEFADILPEIPFEKTYNKKINIDGYLPINIPSEKYFDSMSKYKFILAPPGGGEDTHRCWEALYIGCIPIVRSSNLNELYNDLPVLVVDNITTITKQFLEEKYEIIEEMRKNNKFRMDKLYLKWWIDVINNLRNYTDKVIHFITYGDDNFKRSKERLMQEANLFGEFTHIQSYSPNDLPNQFKNEYKYVLDQKRGGGYWIWKPIILNQALKKLKEGEFLVYLDAGSSLNPLGKKRFFEYIKLLEESEYGVLSIQMSGKRGSGSFEKEKVWTIKQIFDKLEVSLDSDIANSGQYLGGILILKKCDHLDQYMNKYSSFIFKYPELCTDKYNSEKQHVEFKENRHEQSISSIIRKQIGSIVIDADESWMTQFGKGESLKYPFWATRYRG